MARKTVSQAITGIGEMMFAKLEADTGEYSTEVYTRNDINTLTMTSTRTDVNYYGSDRLVLSDTSITNPGFTIKAPQMSIEDWMTLIGETSVEEVLATNGLLVSKRVGIKLWQNLKSGDGAERRYYFFPECEMSAIISLNATTKGETVTFQDEEITVKLFEPTIRPAAMRSGDTMLCWETLGKTATVKEERISKSMDATDFSWYPGKD